MQIFVLGMHRSGTSAFARLLNLMGVYFGGENAGIGRNEENQKGFWERQDVRQLNDTILFNKNCDWDRVSGLDLNTLEEREIFEQAAADIVLNMDAHRPWFMKEPRFCILFPIWRSALEFPFCIHINRNPLEIAHSLKVRNDIPISVGLALWQFYTTQALAASKTIPRIFLNYEELLETPRQTVDRIYLELSASGIQNLRHPNTQELLNFLDPELRRHHKSQQELKAIATVSQLDLYEFLKSSNQPADFKTPPLSSQCIDTLREYERSIDMNERIAKANAHRQTNDEQSCEIQLAIKRLELTQALESNKKLSIQIKSEENQIFSINKMLENISLRRSQALSVIRQQDDYLSNLKIQIAKILELKNQLTETIEALVQSKRWRLGNLILTVCNAFFFRTAPKTIISRLSKANFVFRTVRKNRRDLAIQIEIAILRGVALIPYQFSLLDNFSEIMAVRDEHIMTNLLLRNLHMELRKKEIAELINHIDHIALIGESFLQSRRWHLGNWLGTLPYKLFFRSPSPTAAQILSEYLQKYRNEKTSLAINLESASQDPNIYFPLKLKDNRI